ncbi:MAG: sodium:proton antiporter [Haliea sp.]|jgi:multicomponent Na+:H+ antiporter subunit E|uniref:Na+/H+ antiporter subunit E n=1 Tax=Haliea sp. TaxID=1932666 RepID=UPI000C4ED023|nr:Na+/H+ antiporter subunit E [Haliea sp.]MBM68355.1 sodium:proton antiporter [Haliea sp.]|tara:strand:+ start:92006 stop:92485 length:480 start_codon:yes stop_codon:yes gene_type:complete
MRLMRPLLAVIALFAVWLLWGGLYKTPVLQLGIVSCVLVVWLTYRMALPDQQEHRLALLYRVPLYWLWLLWEMVVTNVQVLRLVLGPRSALSPTIVEVDASASSKFALTLLGNSITLTPGTLTINIDDTRLTAHCLTRAAAEDLRGGGMARRVAAVDPD